MKKFLLPPQLNNPKKLLRELKARPEQYWVRRGEKQALRLFHAMAERVPAYKNFLKKHKIRAGTIKTIQDFKAIPPIDKDNYLRAYQLNQLCWDGKLKEKPWVFSSTSGSTGEPFYFPRQELQDEQYATLAELYLLTNFSIDTRSTLYINCFPMGAWIGGVFTYEAITTIARRRNYPLSIISPGIQKEEILRAIKRLGGNFDQILIGAYGPFLKDILDDGMRAGIDWKKYNLGFIFSAEGFSETFRDYVLETVGAKDIYRTTLNHYGTVDLGTMSYETPISILIRRMAVEDFDLYKKLFGNITKLPTLTQYLPELFYFEEQNGSLFCSAFSGLPLVRYDLKDNGGVVNFNEMNERLEASGKNLTQEARKAKIASTLWKLPFVYVYERSDLSVSLYAFQVYPETIRRALQVKNLQKHVTGKFTMMVQYTKQHEQYLELHVELKADISATPILKKRIQKYVFAQLLKENSEYRETYKEKGSHLLPRIVLWPYEDSHYFKPGGKQKWVKKN